MRILLQSIQKVFNNNHISLFAGQNQRFIVFFTTVPTEKHQKGVVSGHVIHSEAGLTSGVKGDFEMSKNKAYGEGVIGPVSQRQTDVSGDSQMEMAMTDNTAYGTHNN